MSAGSADDGGGRLYGRRSALTCAANRARPTRAPTVVAAGRRLVGRRASASIAVRAGDDVGDGGDGGGGGRGRRHRAGGRAARRGAAEVNGTRIARNAAARGAVVVAAAALGAVAPPPPPVMSANAAAVDGGAAYVAAGTLRAMSTAWEDNAAGGGGGVIAVEPSGGGGGGAAVIFEACSVLRNRAAHGGVGFSVSQQPYDFAAALPGCDAKTDGAAAANACEGNTADEWGDAVASWPAELAFGVVIASSTVARRSRNSRARRGR